MVDPFITITDFLKSNNVQFETIEHEPVYTSEQAAKVRGLSLNTGAKSLLLKINNYFVLAVLPGDRKLDSKKLRTKLGIKDLRFATPEEVKEVMGCEIGACYPFGNLIETKMIVDNTLSKNDIISFNPGVHSKSIKIKWTDYYKAIKPELMDLSV